MHPGIQITALSSIQGLYIALDKFWFFYLEKQEQVRSSRFNFDSCITAHMQSTY
jgi:hypothetical protein